MKKIFSIEWTPRWGLEITEKDFAEALNVFFGYKHEIKITQLPQEQQWCECKYPCTDIVGNLPPSTICIHCELPIKPQEIEPLPTIPEGIKETQAVRWERKKVDKLNEIIAHLNRGKP